ncbi:MAG: hypothetical protein WBD40_04955 [Tepidisphaeraceae bacterium]
MSIAVEPEVIREVKDQLKTKGRREILARLQIVEPALSEEISRSICELWDALEAIPCSPEKRHEIHVRCANAILEPVEALWRATRSALGASRTQTNLAKLQCLNTETKLSELIEQLARREA